MKLCRYLFERINFNNERLINGSQTVRNQDLCIRDLLTRFSDKLQHSGIVSFMKNLIRLIKLLVHNDDDRCTMCCDSKSAIDSN